MFWSWASVRLLPTIILSTWNSSPLEMKPSLSMSYTWNVTAPPHNTHTTTMSDPKREGKTEEAKERAGSGRRRTAQLALEVVPVGEGGEGLDELSELDLLVLVGVEYGYDPTQQWIASQLRDRQEFICWSAIVEKEEES